MKRRFAQVDVFSAVGTLGNPVAVVLDGDGLTPDEMAAFARWTNLSETTFVLPATDPAADYRLVIYTPGGELPFAGHPTLGSAFAWLAAGGSSRRERIVQECGIGLVEIREEAGRLSFAAPPLTRSGAVDATTVDEVCAALGVGIDEVSDAQWVVNGPEWMVLRLPSAQRVLDVTPDMAALGDHLVGLVGAHPVNGDAAIEVRAFGPGVGVPEDPVTGSLNAGIAVWLRATDAVPSQYIATQGAALGRAGRVHVDDDGTDIWIGGDCIRVIDGTVDI
ncbi:PhzF family phenazine biosynthesis protein [Gordonia sp. ABSL49_1]|uniref:PhzF family phenazine biosynthesis protein n=1 Tax=unclassified Gordonia (in: high G+C Gram-positive bacteria) TaxID=2657482 RepID=UPI001F0D3EEA|nr:PhzF family phenazine biosynthesis protein [Gordonia sp. ABSL49_1]MCH5641974.1 PhzF family phenazine biosynthesis protein [Gordonia sp. ABSL49_1]